MNENGNILFLQLAFQQKASIQIFKKEIQMDKDSHPIDLPKLKSLIHNGIEAIPVDKQNTEAVILIGDTGVGKSTIMSFINGSKLIVKYDGLKPVLDTEGQTRIKIGHEKFSETSIPTKVVIDKMAFYDCPGFKDNKGQEFEISNSFFVQRLLDIYQKVKLVLVVDETHISEARADKLPKLIRNLLKAFKTFQDIKEGVLMIINRAGKDNSIEDYQNEIQKMIVLNNSNTSLFLDEQRNFMNFLVKNKRILLFKQAQKENKNQQFQASKNQRNILQCIKDCRFVKSKHILNILSESAKLSIRDFIDEITIKSNGKIDVICIFLINSYTEKANKMGSNINEILVLKQGIIKLIEQIKSSRKQDVLNILQRELPAEQLQDFQYDFSSVMFFKGIYDKTSTYFSNLVNKIYSELSHLLTNLDKRIVKIQKQQQQQVQQQVIIKQEKIRQEKREQEKRVVMEHCSKMDDLKVVAKTLLTTKRSLIEEIKSAMRSLQTAEEEIKSVKRDAITLKNTSKQIDHQFERIQTTYFTKKVVRG